MNVTIVANEVGDALRVIADLNVPGWGDQRVASPFALIPLPDVTFDATYGRGSDKIEDWLILILLARPTSPETRRAIAEYADGSGPKSVKQAIEAHTYTACSTPRVMSVEFDGVNYDGTDYLAAMFHVEIMGGGA